jgi:hypothetical protein
MTTYVFINKKQDRVIKMIDAENEDEAYAGLKKRLIQSIRGKKLSVDVMDYLCEFQLGFIL